MPIQFARNTIDVGIVSKDLESAHKFYGETLGLPVDGDVSIPEFGFVRRYVIGDNILRVFIPDTVPALEGSKSGFASQTGIRYLTLKISNLDAVVADIARAGFQIMVPIRELAPGRRVAQVQDNEGNTLELMQED